MIGAGTDCGVCRGLPFRCGGPTVDTAGDEAWPKHLKEACSPEESSEAPFSFFCCSSYERMDCRASCFLCTRTQVIIGGSHSSQVRNNMSSAMDGVEAYLRHFRQWSSALAFRTDSHMRQVRTPNPLQCHCFSSPGYLSIRSCHVANFQYEHNLILKRKKLLGMH